MNDKRGRREKGTDTHCESSYLMANADISMSLNQQLNHCHMAHQGGQEECCVAILHNVKDCCNRSLLHSTLPELE